MRKISLLFFALCVFSASFLHAQVGINILIPDSSAVLQLESNKKGLGLPRLTEVQKNAIPNPLRGLTIFNTTDSFVEYWTGQCWLRAYQNDCDQCAFTASIDDPTDTLDRIVDDSVFSTITIDKTFSTKQVNVSYIVSPPNGVTVYADGNTTIDSSGQIKLVVKADIFADDGLVPIVIIAYCGDQIKLLSYNVYIEPCVKVTIPLDVTNYDLQAVNPIPLPAGSRKCVVLTVNGNVEVHSATASKPSYTTGNLDPLSKVGIVNNGAFLGRGGDGGYGGTFNSFPPGQVGGNGGNALNLTTRTILKNNGAIYGGGGGGGSVGLQTPNINVGGINLCIALGVGGGGGSENGLGGGQGNGSCLFNLFTSGTNATSGVNSVPGQGATLSVPVPITISFVTITITPSGTGGDGGPYGQPGGSGSVNLTLRFCVSIPIIGSVCANVPIPGLPVNGAPGGAAGLAVKRNNNPLTNLPDANYNTNQVKGTVAP